MQLDCEAGAAATGSLRVRIVDLERCADEFLYVVEFRTFQERQRNGVNQDRGAGLFNDEIVRVRHRDEIEFVLEAGAAAAFDAEAQQFIGCLGRRYCIDAGGSGGADADRRLFSRHDRASRIPYVRGTIGAQLILRSIAL